MTIDTTNLLDDGKKVKLARPALLEAVQRLNDLASTSDTAKGVSLVGSAGRVVDSISALRALPKTGSATAFVLGFYAKGDGGGGNYFLDESDTTSAETIGVVIVATDGGRWKLAKSSFITFRQFGAVGNGVTDDTASINAAFSYLRALIVKANGVTQGESVKLLFGYPGDVFKVAGSINATGLKGLNVVIDGGGAVILGACAGKPVFDMRNCRWYSVYNLNIWGDVTSTPSYGVTVGRTLLSGSSAGDGSFTDCAYHGYYTKACFYNFTAETVQYRHCRFYNSYVGTGANCIVMDGVNNYNVTSEFTTQQNSADVAVSFNENNFYGCDFRRVGSTGTDACIRYIGHGARHGYIISYAANDAGDIVEYYKPITPHLIDLVLDIHAEVDNGTSGVRNLLLVDTALSLIHI